ncbi:MAG: hypothetical protein J5795_00970 [Lachnospiraceae bacterium]|nr:hypothetical protein [Lachnospiraceae bacterium]
MKAMRNVYKITYLLLCALEILVAFLIFLILRPIVGGQTAGIVFGILCVAAFPMGFVLLKGLLKNEKGKESATLHEAFRNEILKNGFTQSALDIANQAIREHTSGKKMNVMYLKDFAMYAADYFNQVKDYETAQKYVDVIDEKEIRSKSISFIDRGISLLLYLSVRMDTYSGLKEEKTARAIMDEAHSRFDSSEDEMFKILLDGIDYNYYAMQEDYAKAQTAADRLLAYTSDFAKQYSGKYFINADLRCRLGKREEAAEFMRNAWEQVKDQGEAVKQTYRLAMKRFGLPDETEEDGKNDSDADQ